MTSDTHSAIGRRGEDAAAAFLEAKGFRVLERNYRFERSEVDLVCFLPAPRWEDGGEMVFVEVKARSGADFGHGEEAVTPEKQRHLVRAARAWLHERKMEGTPARFDVVAIGTGPRPEIRHTERAFWIF